MLRRVVQADKTAFAELVRRHGRLVWATCRHLTGSDTEADDAFQATFLVLFRSAKSIRERGRLSSWLHGVAYRVCLKARRSSKRRALRERAAAVHERCCAAVPDSAWDRALATVHEEAAKLPETLRIPFVLCCLEGKSVTEAAEQVGWKFGTFSGRLTRAKDAILAKLDSRGLTLGVVASLGLAAPSAAVIASTVALVNVGSTVPRSILDLAHGAIGMNIKSIKQLAAIVVVTGVLGLGVGTNWMATADAQSAQPKLDPKAEVQRLQAELDKARAAAEDAEQKQQRLYLDALRAADRAFVADLVLDESPSAAKATKWEYDLVAVSDMDRVKFVKYLQDREHSGWEFNGTSPLKDGDKMNFWVFRRPSKAALADNRLSAYYELFNAKRTNASGRPPEKSSVVPPKAADDNRTSPPIKLGDTKAVEAEIARLQERIAELKARASWSRVVFMKDKLPLEPTEMMSVLARLMEKKFTKDRFSLSASVNGIALEGDKEVIEWVSSLVKKLSEK